MRSPYSNQRSLSPFTQVTMTNFVTLFQFVPHAGPKTCPYRSHSRLTSTSGWLIVVVDPFTTHNEEMKVRRGSWDVVRWWNVVNSWLTRFYIAESAASEVVHTVRYRLRLLQRQWYKCICQSFMHRLCVQPIELLRRPSCCTTGTPYFIRYSSSDADTPHEWTIKNAQKGVMVHSNWLKRE